MAYTLGCVVLNNHDNQERLKEEEDFKFDVLLDLLQSSNKVTWTLPPYSQLSTYRPICFQSGHKWCLLTLFSCCITFIDRSIQQCLRVFFRLQQIRLKAGFALSIFAFNNTPQQYAIRAAGGIRYRCFEQAMESDDEHERCNAAFQVTSPVH